MEIKTPTVGDHVEYRVLRNPGTAPNMDYVAEAVVTYVHGDGVTLHMTVCPKRSDPFQIGPVPHHSIRTDDSPRFEVWANLDEKQE